MPKNSIFEKPASFDYTGLKLIFKALKSDDEVEISMTSIAAQRAFVYQEG